MKLKHTQPQMWKPSPKESWIEDAIAAKTAKQEKHLNRTPAPVPASLLSISENVRTMAIWRSLNQ